MKALIFAIFTYFIFTSYCSGQVVESRDFIELGIRTSSFVESSFLENSTYQSLLSDPRIDDEGLTPSATGRNYSARLRYGKFIASRAHLIGEIGYNLSSG